MKNNKKNNNVERIIKKLKTLKNLVNKNLSGNADEQVYQQINALESEIGKENDKVRSQALQHFNEPNRKLLGYGSPTINKPKPFKPSNI